MLIKSEDGVVFFILIILTCNKLFAILIFKVDFSETDLMTSAENSVSELPNLNIVWWRIPPTRLLVIMPPPPPPVTKNLAMGLQNGNISESRKSRKI